MVTVAPDPCLIVILCEPEVAFSIIQTLLTVFGAIVNSLVAVKLAPDVTFKYKLRIASVAPSAKVVVALASLLKEASVPKLKASAINSRLVFVVSPHVPDCSPEPISSNLKSLVYTLAIAYLMLLYQAKMDLDLGLLYCNSVFDLV